jgi:hypothetical protein
MDFLPSNQNLYTVRYILIFNNIFKEIFYSIFYYIKFFIQSWGRLNKKTRSKRGLNFLTYLSIYYLISFSLKIKA